MTGFEGRFMTHVKNWAFLAVAAGVFAGVAAYHSAAHRAARSAARESDLLIRGDPADKAIQARIAAKEAAVKDLIAGRLTLVQTAAVFRTRRPGACGPGSHRLSAGRLGRRSLLPLRY